ncbi:MAG TPA: glycosyltransferase [Candidatus Saccharimonadales bacterium]
MKIAVITCYDQRDYIRAKGLRTALRTCKNVELTVIKNKYKGLLRYLEVPLAILRLRFTVRPDAYVVTFRGYEMLLYMRLTGVRKPIIFDELINFVEYYEEHGVLRAGTLPDRLLRRFYRWQIRGCYRILADTSAHADFSAQTTGVPRTMYQTIPIAADERLFFPGKEHPKKPFMVFYYGNGMTPLHGLQYVLDAAVLLKDNPDIQFSLVGGKQKAADACAVAAAHGAHVTYEQWIPFEEIPVRARQAGLCLGGPFGKTLQSQFVVTGKTTQFMACAAPVLIGKNKVSGAFKDRQNCLLVPPADAPAIAKAITWAFAHQSELRHIGAAGRDLYEREFSQAVVNQRVQELVVQLKANRK